MTHENAFKIMYNCMKKSFKTNDDNESASLEFNLYSTPKTEEEIQAYLSNIYNIYKDEVTAGCADGIGYFININRVCDTHFASIFVTIFLLLVADANMYILYDGSYYDKDRYPSALNRFLDELLNTYDKAKKITVVKEMTYSTDTVLDYVFARNRDIKHIVYFGDFINYYPSKRVLSKTNIKIHLPSAHYVIVNYSKSDIPAHDKQVLRSFGIKCYKGYIDYAAYESSKNKHTESYGFDTLKLYTDLALFNTLKDHFDRIDKVVTILFTDKSKDELGYPEEFYKGLDVHFSKNYNDNILNYNYSQLFK